MKAKDVRKGTVIIYQNAPHRVMEFIHRTPGNLRAFVQAKLKNLLTGISLDTRFSSVEDLAVADVFSLKGQYLYREGDTFYFMNVDNYDQLAISADLIGESADYLIDNCMVEILTFNDNPISIDLPKTVELTITDCPPEIKGASATNSPKIAQTNTGLAVSVPSFLKAGDRIVVNTSDGAYIGKAAN